MTIDLAFDHQHAQIATQGGRLVRYVSGGREVLGSIMASGPTTYHGALLAPWPNRVPGGRWMWQGEVLQLPVNDPETGAALHGLVHDAEFAVRVATAERVRLSYDLAPSPGYPFPLRLEAEYQLSEAGLRCRLRAINTGAGPVPVGLGAHPYVDAPYTVDVLSLTVPAQTLLELDVNGRRQPTEPVSVSDKDFRQSRVVGASLLDTAFTELLPDPDHRVRVAVAAPSERDIVLTLGSTCRWLMVFTADLADATVVRRGLALEPMTCAPGDLAGADILQPGEELELEWAWSVD